MTKQDLAKIEDEVNATFRKMVMEVPEFRRLFVTATPRYRYWRKNNKKFGWTTERCGDKKFHAFIYRVHKDKSEKLVKDLKFGRRKVAKAKALAWYKKEFANATA